MKNRMVGALLVAVLIDAFAAFVGVLIWRWLHHMRGAEIELFCLLAIVAMLIVGELAAQLGAWVFLPPVMFAAWLCGVLVSPLVVVGVAIQRTLEFVRIWRAWRLRRSNPFACR